MKAKTLTPKASARPVVRKIAVQNVNAPGLSTNVDADKYEAMKKALLKALPKKSPGLTQAEMLDALKLHLSQELFPNGDKAGWWMKCVQLDLEAKKLLVREASKPLRWYRV
jgi:hypothetical protein